MNLTEMVVDHSFQFSTLLRTSDDVCEAFLQEVVKRCSCECARYSGIVRTMPAYLLSDLWVFDLEIYFVIFISVAYS